MFLNLNHLDHILFTIISFADPTNCSQYYICAGAGGDVQTYQCPSGYVYNPTTNLCKRRLWITDCPNINCANNKNRNIPYPGNPGYYVYCMYIDNALTPLVFQCSDPVNLAFNQNTQTCEINCKTEGRFANSGDCTSYYECYYSGFRLVGREQTCLYGFIYNATTNRCQVGTC